jgi:hypothetical protein
MKMATKKRANKPVKNVVPKPARKITVRMYRQGLGDCFLIALPQTGTSPFYIMIDCGVILGTPDAASKMQNVVQDIINTTKGDGKKGHINLLLATHEHWDHLSGFNQAKDLFANLEVDDVWLAWTEDPKDDLAKRLRSEHQAMRLAVASACARMRFGGGQPSAADALMEFFGAAGQGSTGDALKVVRSLIKGKDPRYCRPTDDPVELKGAGARLYILGPPHDEKAIKRYNPSKSHPETYGITKMAMDQLVPGILNSDVNAPLRPHRANPAQHRRPDALLSEPLLGRRCRFRRERSVLAPH